MEGNYEKILEKISKLSGVEKEEIDKRVEVKRTKLSGLISKEGAAQVVAAELNVSFENEILKIDEILPGMRKVQFVGKVIDISPVRTFVRDGNESKVVNLTVADETSNIRVVLWDTNHIELIESGDVSKGSVIEIGNSSVRDSEIHLGSFSEFKLSKEKIEEVRTEKIVKEKQIFDFKISDNISTRAHIVQMFDPRAFYVCIDCKKKVTPEGDSFVCQEHGTVASEKRFILNIILDDGSETIRGVLFHDTIPTLGIEDVGDEEKFKVHKENLLGKEMIFSGSVRNNSYFNNKELILNDVHELDPDALLATLEKK
jgi:ssDNA-binding replication factor A large subunit